LLTVVVPLLVLYLRGNWPLGKVIACLLIIPILWYLTYALLHELSHVVGTYLAGGRVTYVKLIPRFWAGEFSRAWITPEGLGESWQQLIMTSSPYVLDIVSVVVGFCLLRRDFSKNPFVVGLILVLLCLRPTFDLVCETISFVSGNRGDLFYIDETIGRLLTWSFLIFAIGLSLFSVVKVLSRFIGAPHPSTL
jgi:hypothetical protein